MRILTVCGMGFGTSLMLLMSIQEIAKKYNIKVTGEACDLGSAKGKPCDLIVTSSEIAREFSGSSIKVVGINNLVDKKEIEEKVMPIIREFTA